MKQINIFRTARYLFVRSGCPHCREYLPFIERINLALPIDKRIEVIDCSVYQEFGIIDPIIRIFWKYIRGFPHLFFMGYEMEGSRSKEEMEAFIRSLVQPDFKTPEQNQYYFNKECKFINKAGMKLQCE